MDTYAVYCILKVKAENSWDARDKGGEALADIQDSTIDNLLVDEPYVLKAEVE